MGSGERLAVAPDELSVAAAGLRSIAAELHGPWPGDPPLGEAACAAALREVGRLLAQAQIECGNELRSLAGSLDAGAVPSSAARGGA